jgi:hypothetical protein
MYDGFLIKGDWFGKGKQKEKHTIKEHTVVHLNNIRTANEAQEKRVL